MRMELRYKIKDLSSMKIQNEKLIEIFFLCGDIEPEKIKLPT